ncbi:MAG: ABC transporter ATP-binding protein [Defluviitaleaceae bacterium]|nr:ABC transporter ATP-binding protein [Defluviitaleaceae bacterium]
MENQSNVILEVKDLKKYFGKGDGTTKALDGINFTINRGDFISIMGKSGSGKTTLLNILSTIDIATHGDVLLNGSSIFKLKSSKKSQFRRDNLGFIFQDFKLIDNLTAFENIALALIIQDRYKANEIEHLTNEIAKALEISHILDKYPYQLSGGQKQRVSVARAIVKKPTLIIADEPTGALDSENSKRLMEMFEKINKELKNTILIVTHDEYVASFSDRTLTLKDGIFEKVE